MANDKERKDEQRLNERYRQTGRALAFGIESELNRQDWFLTGLNFKRRGGEWMLIAKRETDEGEGEVAFRTGEDIDAIVRSFESGVRSDDIKWREDKPYEG